MCIHDCMYIDIKPVSLQNKHDKFMTYILYLESISCKWHVHPRVQTLLYPTNKVKSAVKDGDI